VNGHSNASWRRSWIESILSCLYNFVSKGGKQKQ
jgi:hypothetical protein